jgi:hypothetical protein
MRASSGPSKAKAPRISSITNVDASNEPLDVRNKDLDACNKNFLSRDESAKRFLKLRRLLYDARPSGRRDRSWIRRASPEKRRAE